LAAKSKIGAGWKHRARNTRADCHFSCPCPAFIVNLLSVWPGARSAIHKRKEDGIVWSIRSDAWVNQPADNAERPVLMESRNSTSSELQMEKCSFCYERLGSGRNPSASTPVPCAPWMQAQWESDRRYGAGREADGFSSQGRQGLPLSSRRNETYRRN